MNPKIIDHTILNADATEADVDRVLEEAVRYHFGAVCIEPAYIAYAKEKLAGTDVRIATVVGFPLGMNTSNVKAYEAKEAVSLGADEIDMVMNVGFLKDRRVKEVEEDIHSVRKAIPDHVLLKVILETALLTDEEIAVACRIAEEAGADFVKTSTGFGPGGASVHAVGIMKDTVGDRLGIKASGGIGDLATAEAMIEAGATRLGMSKSVRVMEEWEREN